MNDNKILEFRPSKELQPSKVRVCALGLDDIDVIQCATALESAIKLYAACFGAAKTSEFLKAEFERYDIHSDGAA